ncbi:MAG: indole-3-glycerol phosphate synthase TrpC [Syntrophobacterales bacterium]|nr:indole-3-glycerol phosphate synthase TrpC [Syntrophobacterales bacterium]
MILAEIVAKKRNEVATRQKKTPFRALAEKIARLPPTRDFSTALKREIAIIAELKRRSPSHGLLRKEFDPAKIALLYEKNGAAAISVLTDETFFGGSDNDIAAVKNAVLLPVLRKEFIIDPYQIAETRAIGADALLLIASLLGERELRDYRKQAESLGLAALVEVHSQEELWAALASGARIIGVNNRNLDTLATDLCVSRELGPLLPPGLTKVSESGIETETDIAALRAAGFNAFLIGGALLSSPDPGAKLRNLTKMRGT